MEEDLIDDVAADEAPAPVESTRDIIAKAVEAQREKAADPEAPKEEDKPKRFTQAEREEAARKAKEPPKPVEAVPAQVAQPKAPVSHIAPSDFAKLPPHVQQALQRREEEVSNGFKVLQDYKGLEAYKGYVENSRTTFANVFKSAIEWETSLARHPVHTVHHVIGLAAAAEGITPAQFMQRLFAATPAQGQQQPGHRPGQQQMAAQGMTSQPAMTAQQIEEIARSTWERQSAEQRSAQEVQQFMSDPAYEHAGDLAEEMAFLIENGKAEGLRDAYEKAAWAHPEIRARLIEKQRNPQTRPSNPGQAKIVAAKAASKATVGAPRSGQAPQRVAAPASTKTMDIIRAAVAAQRGDDL